MRNVLITAAAGLVLAFVVGKHSASEARAEGRIAGCNVMLAKIANPAAAPECALQNGKLVVRFTNPNTGEAEVKEIE